ncbi:TPA: hypothetical protein N0F65_006764 [Lagenidium giganteum]|uniref:RING-type E3 ubiquitin transferase n=1 Tax=Lagenidium giganteum TaxID=4803 RepID=A0AAV2YVR6_9STRA|nr:TPA: hypothetical protein N0F65_006764 [Lagenidium giganteum]
MAKSPLPCKFFLQNTCTAGRYCRFSHDIDDDARAALERVSASTGERALAPGAIKVPCRFFNEGGCATGNNCPYLHVSGDAEEKPKAKPKPAAKPVKMYVLSKKTKNAPVSGKPAGSSEDEKEKKSSNGSDQQVTELSDIISKEEELYYYGAPGQFMDPEQMTPEEITAAMAKLNMPSFLDVAKRHAQDDDTDSTFFHEERAAEPKCTFFIQGLCRYGDSCFYSHSLDAPVETEEEMLKVGEELRLSAELECNICYDNILQKGERFGLLSGCTHPFCLSCVRNWRGNADQPKQTVRQCPVCRVETHFVVPSNRMVSDPERKKALVSSYVQNLSGIPCRHFDEGRGTCPFGTSCFYAHKYADGTLDPRQVRTAVDADGHYDVLREVRLEQFLKRQ